MWATGSTYFCAAGAGLRVRDPGKATCDAISNLNHGDESYRFRPGRGYYCGSTNNVGFTSFLNGEKSANGYGSLKYQFNENTQFYADGLFDIRAAR